MLHRTLEETITDLLQPELGLPRCTRHRGRIHIITTAKEFSVSVAQSAGGKIHPNIAVKGKGFPCCTEHLGNNDMNIAVKGKGFPCCTEHLGNTHMNIAVKGNGFPCCTERLGNNDMNIAVKGKGFPCCTERLGNNDMNIAVKGKRLSMLHRTLRKQ